jgi:hypothetical protein
MKYNLPLEVGTDVLSGQAASSKVQSQESISLHKLDECVEEDTLVDLLQSFSCGGREPVLLLLR